jgi:serpin B
VSRLAPHRVVVGLPKFQLSAGFELKAVLSALGMPLAFTPGSADFSGMDGTRDLYLSAVVHEAVVEVDEEGTEAAAATAVVGIRLAARPEPPVTFRADHPFLFLIRDVRTGSILFLGRVANPRP